MFGLSAAAAQLLRDLAGQGTYGFCLDHAAIGWNHLTADNLIDSNPGEDAFREKPVSTFSQHAVEVGEPRILVVVGQWHGVSLRRASAPLAAAVELESGAFAAWQGGSGTRRRLMLTAHGWNAVSENFALGAPEEIFASGAFLPPYADADAELWLPAST